MTRAEIEDLLTDLALVARYLETCARVARDTAERMATAADYLQTIATKTDRLLHGHEDA